LPGRPDTPTDAAPPRCPNCGAVVQGAWCASCGQESLAAGLLARTLRRQWQRIRHTIVALVAHPGLLTAEFRDGLRARSIAPWRLTLNTVAFFFLLSFVTDFRIAHIAEQDRSGMLARAIADVAASAHVSPALFAERIDHRFNAVYTLLLGLSVAWYALLAGLLHWRQRRPVSVHVVFGLHYVAWIFAVTLVYFLAARLLSIETVISVAHPDLRSLGLFALVLAWSFGYVAIAFRRVYADSRAAAALKAALVVVAGALVDNLVVALSFYVALRIAAA
jgi:hypothetical protein